MSIVHPHSRIAMVLYGDLTFDSRVRKEARALAGDGFAVDVHCLASEGTRSDLPAGVEVKVHPLPTGAIGPAHVMRAPNPFRARTGGLPRSPAGRARWLYSYTRALRRWGRSVVVAAGHVEAWHLHDLTALAAATPFLRQGDVIIYDSHELYIEGGTAALLPPPVKYLLRRYERHLVRKAAAVVTVNEDIARIIAQRYRPRRVEIVRNCPEMVEPSGDRPTLLRDAAGIPSDAPVVLYHGSLTAGRGIEQLMESMLQPGLERAHLALLGMGANRPDYAAVAAGARWGGRVHVLDPVPPAELLPWVASADVGVLPNPGATLNDTFTSPNKLFECLAAGIPVVGSDLPTIRRIIIDDPGGPLGTVCDPSRSESIAAAVRTILDLDERSADAMRERCIAAARARWNWEREAQTLRELYRELLPWPTAPHSGGATDS